MSKFEDSNILIADLCERFTKIFQEIKEMKEARVDLENENEEIKISINDEIQNHQQSIEKFQKEILDLQSFQDENLTDDTNLNEKELKVIDNEVENEKLLTTILKKQFDEVFEKKNKANKKKEELHQLCEILLKENEVLSNKISGFKESSKNMEKESFILERNICEMHEKNDIETQNIEETENLLREGFEEKFRIEDEYKNLSLAFREILKKNSNQGKLALDLEKENTKNYEELKMKMQRLELLLKMNTKLTLKLSKFEDNAGILEDLVERNKEIQLNNQGIQEKIEILIQQPIDKKYKAKVKKLLFYSKQKTHDVNNFSMYRPNFAKALKKREEMTEMSHQRKDVKKKKIIRLNSKK